MDGWGETEYKTSHDPLSRYNEEVEDEVVRVDGPVIVGVGPSGLAVAACLSKKGIPSVILERTRWQPGGGGKNKKCHLSGNAEVVPVSEPLIKVVPVFEPRKMSCQYLIFTLKVVPLYDVNPLKFKSTCFAYGYTILSRLDPWESTDPTAQCDGPRISS